MALSESSKKTHNEHEEEKKNHKARHGQDEDKDMIEHTAVLRAKINAAMDEDDPDKKHEFLKQAMDMVDELKKKTEKRIKRVWALTSLGAGIVIGLDLFIINYWLTNPGIVLTGFLIAIALITFLGMLIVSSFHSEQHPKHVKGSSGVMRRALAVSFVVVYFVVFSVIVFGEPTYFDDQNSVLTTTLEDHSEEGISSEEVEHEEDSKQIKVDREVLLDHLTKIIITILAFYFGTKGAKEIAEIIKNAVLTSVPV